MASVKPIRNLQEISTAWVSEILKESLSGNITVKEVNFSNSYTSDGYLSDIAFCTVELDGYSRPTLSLVVKILPTDNERKEFLLSLKLANSEAIFNKFLISKKMKDFLASKSVTLPIPSIFFSALEEDAFTLVMENMFPLGFSRIINGGGVDLETTKKAMHALATFHGVMFSFFNENPFIDMGELLTKREERKEVFFKMLFSGLQSITKTNKNKEVCEKIDSLLSSGNYKKLVEEPMLSLPKTLIHGDYWTGQTLFDHKSACILDWQFVDHGNVTDDIACFLYMSCSKEFLEYPDEIISTYFLTLNSILLTYDCTISITQKLIEECLEKSLVRGLLTLVCSVETFLENGKITHQRLEDLMEFSLKKGLLD